MDYSFLFDTIRLRKSIVHNKYLGVSGYNFQKKNTMIFFTFTNSEPHRRHCVVSLSKTHLTLLSTYKQCKPWWNAA